MTKGRIPLQNDIGSIMAIKFNDDSKLLYHFALGCRENSLFPASVSVQGETAPIRLGIRTRLDTAEVMGNTRHAPGVGIRGNPGKGTQVCR